MYSYYLTIQCVLVVFKFKYKTMIITSLYTLIWVTRDEWSRVTDVF